MMIVRGVNVFPSQIEHALLGVEGLAPHYQIVLSTGADRQTDLMVRVETAADHVAAAEPGRLAALEARAGEVLRGALGLSVAIELVAPHVISRSEGKAVRVLDRRTQAP